MVRFERHPVFGDAADDEIESTDTIEEDGDDQLEEGEESPEGEDPVDEGIDDDEADESDSGDDGEEDDVGDDEDDDGPGFLHIPEKSEKVTITVDPETGALTIENPAVTLTIDRKETERLALEDGYIALDTEGNAGQAYRLYEAAFDRDPDPTGLGYWIRQLDEGGGDLVAMAALFLQSDEFDALYGQNLDDEAFIEQLYQNILDRAGEEQGIAYWAKQLGEGADRATVLASFSESNENKTNVADEIDTGIYYV